MEPNQQHQQEEPLSSTVSGNGGNVGAAGAANGSLGPMPKYECDRDKTDLIPTTLWNSVTGKLSHKTGSSSVTTPDGTFFYFSSKNFYFASVYLKIRVFLLQPNIHLDIEIEYNEIQLVTIFKETSLFYRLEKIIFFHSDNFVKIAVKMKILKHHSFLLYCLENLHF